MFIEIRPIETHDREWLRKFLLAHNHSLLVVSRGVLHQADSLPGFIAFYGRRGMRLVAVHENVLQLSRRLKPEISLISLGGLPLRDELEFELRLQHGSGN